MDAVVVLSAPRSCAALARVDRRVSLRVTRARYAATSPRVTASSRWKPLNTGKLVPTVTVHPGRGAPDTTVELAAQFRPAFALMVGTYRVRAARSAALVAAAPSSATATLGDASTARRTMALSSSASGRMASEPLSALAPTAPSAPASQPRAYEEATIVSVAAKSWSCLLVD